MPLLSVSKKKNCTSAEVLFSKTPCHAWPERTITGAMKTVTKIAQVFLISLPCTLLALRASAAEPSLTLWEGKWRGECLSQNLQQKVLRFKTELTIKQINAEETQWHLQYEGQAVRPYTLKKQTAAPAEFLLDENNGILLHQTLFPATSSFTSLFSVNNFLLQASYQLVPGKNKSLQLFINTFESTSALPSAAGGNKVQSFRPLVSQSCRFTPSLAASVR
jgi:hypothetical protein